MKSIMTILVACIFAGGFHLLNAAEPLAAYKKDGLWHVVDHEGKEMFSGGKDILDIEGYSEGLIKALKIINGKPRWVFLNLKGDVEIIPNAENCELFREGMSMIYNVVNKEYDDRMYGFIDKNGSEIVPLKYNDALSFSEGKTYVMNAEERGYIDKTGKMLFRLQETKVGYTFSEGLAAISNTDFKVGYMDSTGKIVIELLYDEPDVFREGYAKITEKGKFGYINKYGVLVTVIEFHQARSFSCGVAFVGRFKDQYVTIWGLLNKEGRLVTDFRFQDAKDFSENYAAVKFEGGWGFIDTTGNFAITDNYFYADSFKNGLAWVTKTDKSASGYIDTAGKMAVVLPNADKYVDLRFSRRVY